MKIDYLFDSSYMFQKQLNHLALDTAVVEGKHPYYSIRNDEIIVTNISKTYVNKDTLQIQGILSFWENEAFKEWLYLMPFVKDCRFGVVVKRYEVCFIAEYDDLLLEDVSKMMYQNNQRRRSASQVTTQEIEYRHDRMLDQTYLDYSSSLFTRRTIVAKLYLTGRVVI